MQRYNIRIPFHQQAFVLLAYGLAALVHTIEHLALYVYLVLRGIDVLGRLLIAFEYTCAKAQYTTRHALYGEYHPAAVYIVVDAITVLGQPCTLQYFPLIALGSGRLVKSTVTFRIIAQPETLYDLLPESPLLKVRQAYELSLFRVQQYIMKVGNSIFIEYAQRFFGQLLLLLLGAALGFLQCYLVEVGQPAHGFGIGELFVFLYKGNHIAGLAAPKALINALGR